ncbi:FAD-dependent oxidoreductase [Amorphoplanes digitatis]|uniref:NADPH-dependent 2,4-dienoyl-CoA reductase/sulfur reductase-like enzyme n=1 Tax=Actinoplanes digitatis TaxID=1868 RepID=A0A7W7HSZ2_9ACTN|nr:FAD-dependent oxidoreductase [Actinoplanes digitatis]MBB4760098.1 NADPH-dependent 2,4-dienoyl-CoA reductase/sulfur reductase-like enzyme [Actinoplanes digitatis]GID98515.1 flavoprotein oxidoreductase [Actinoplanes digitatis]
MKLVVIGGDAAGMSAASQARKRMGTGELEIVAFERGRFTSYSACGIPYWIGGVVPGLDPLIARRPEAFREAGIDVRTRHEVVAIDLRRREVTARDLEGGGELREGFDQLVYAAGAVPVTPDWARVDAGGVFGVQTLDDGAAVQAWLDRDPAPRRAVVIGGGYVGVEMAEAMVRRGLDVTLLERSPQPMSTVDEDMGERVGKAIRGLGIEVRTRTPVRGLETLDGRVSAVVTPDGALPADIVVLGLGVRPNTALAAESGIPLGVTGGIRTDLRMRVVGPQGHVDGIWAAGDCVQTVHRVSGRPVHVPLGTHANKQGRVAGINIGGGYATFPGVIGTAVTKVCDLEVARTGLTESEAAQAGFEYVTAAVESTNRAGYYPGAVPMVIKMIAERRTGVLLGAQIVGREEAGKRIDALAIAIWNRMPVEEMTALDLSYAPPFSPVWDPVLIAARKATEAVHAAG